MRSTFLFTESTLKWCLETWCRNKPFGNEKGFWDGILKCFTGRGGERCLTFIEILWEVKLCEIGEEVVWTDVGNVIICGDKPGCLLTMLE